MQNKRLIVCMDGTWQNMATTKKITNVAKIALAVTPVADDGKQQLVYYSPGIGGEAFLDKTKDRIFKGAVGEGAEEAIVAAYLFLSLNYQEGDEIYLFGFSRGAFCVRSLGGFIRACGLIKRENAHMVKKGFELYRGDDTNNQQLKDDRLAFRRAYGILANPGAEEDSERERPPIAYVGVFDTVMMRGMPSTKDASPTSRKYGFHNLMLGYHVRSARHALALDERRNSLRPTPWTNLKGLNVKVGRDPLDPDAPYQQKWFTGAHGDVGGGVSDELSEVSRKWIKRGAYLAGLRFEGEALDIAPEQANVYGFFKGEIEPPKGFLNILGLQDRIAFPDLEEPSKPNNWGEQVEQAGRNVKGKRLPSPADVERLIHVSAYLRARQPGRRPAYNPKTLRPLFDALNKLAAPQGDKEKLIEKLCNQMQYPPLQKILATGLKQPADRIS